MAGALRDPVSVSQSDTATYEIVGLGACVSVAKLFER